jgi:hypothetical protein
MIMRLLFCLLPALLVSLLVGILNPVLGLIFFAGIFGLGIEVTKPGSDR